jgi:4-hydroxymandelate synthase
VARHGDGMADIALSAADTRQAFADAVSRSAVPLAEPAERDGWVTAAVAAGFDDVRHTLVQWPVGHTDTAVPLPGFKPVAEPAEVPGEPVGLTILDHVAVSVPMGQLAGSTGYYERVFGYESVYEELMVQGTEAMDSKAVRSPAGDLTFTILAPSPEHDAGHLGDFLKRHGSGGVHHLDAVAGRYPDALSPPRHPVRGLPRCRGHPPRAAGLHRPPAHGTVHSRPS